MQLFIESKTMIKFINKLAKSFAKYFSKIGKSFAERIPMSKTPTSTKIKGASETEISGLIDKSSHEMSSGHDSLNNIRGPIDSARNNELEK